MPTILMEDGPLAGRRLRVSASLELGRAEGDVRLDDPQVSGRHVRLTPTATGLEVEDLGSTNGTWVNGSRVDRVTEMRPGDRLRVGTTTILLEATSEPHRGAVAPPPPQPFASTPTPAAKRSGIASRRLIPATIAILVIIATASALVLYFALRDVT